MQFLPKGFSIEAHFPRRGRAEGTGVPGLAGGGVLQPAEALGAWEHECREAEVPTGLAVCAGDQGSL